MFPFRLFLASLAAGAFACAAGRGVAFAGDATSFVNPGSWTTGVVNSTYQEWDVFTASTGNTPDVGSSVDPTISSSPTLSVNSPGFKSGSDNFYAFAGDYSAQADIYNHGGSSGSGSYGSTFGTHVIVQTSATMNFDTTAGGPASVFQDSLEIVKHDGTAISGGANADALQIAEIFTGTVSSSFGNVTQQELIFEFWLAGYADDFRVQWDEIVHSQFNQLRVDSLIVEEAAGGGTPLALTPVPEPSTMVLTGIAAAGLGLIAIRRRRKRA